MIRGRVQIEERLRRFIVEELLEKPYNGSDPLADDAVDSLGHEQLIEYVDEIYDVQIQEEDMVKENFESLAALAALIDARR
jgi:acyl carrier protein